MTCSAAYMSWGGGVQSTALAFLIINEDPRLLDVVEALPARFYFADTGDERRHTYLHVWKMAEVFERAGLRLDIVRRFDAQSLSEHVLSKAAAGEGGISLPPVFVEDATGAAMPVRRGCTRDFKAKPLDAKAKADHADVIDRGEVVDQWYGISSDEMRRMRTSPDGWRRFVYPLVWMRWTRWHCEQYLKAQAYADGSSVISARSSCVFCPFHSREEWESVRSHPEDWRSAASFDAALRERGPIAGLKTQGFVHRSRLPLTEAMERQHDSRQLEMWGMDDECLGVCGV